MIINIILFVQTLPQVSCVLHEYFELRPTKPKLRKLRLLLDENQYCGRECEEDELHQGKKVMCRKYF